jgi:hypothetical protein
VFLTLTIAATPTTLAITTTSLPSAQTGVPYTAELAAAGGITPYMWQLVSGALPTGLMLNSRTGQITGTTASYTNTPLVVKVTDSTTPSAQTAAVFLTLTIGSAPTPLTITTTSLASGQTGVPYGASLAATGGNTPYMWQLVSGTLPAGLTLNSLTGQISGTPAAGITNTPLTFRVTDSTTPTNQTSTVFLTLTIAPAPTTLTITTTSLASGQAGVPYGAALAATGGIAPYRWQLASGTLPAGLTLSSLTGQISGTPAVGITNTPLTFKVTDSTTPTAQTATVFLTLTIAAAPTTLTITTTSLPSAQTGVPYGAALAATGGVMPYMWQLVSGSLPAGLTLNSFTGQISGTTTSFTNTPLTIKVTDSSTPTAQTAAVFLTLTIAPPPPPATLTITTTSLPSAQIGVPYAALLTAAGGTSPYMWTLTSRRVPSWLTLNPMTGQISGIPPADASNLALTFQVTDSTIPAVQTATASLTLPIGSASITAPPPPATLTITTTSLPTAQAGVPYGATLAAVGGTAAYSWQLVSGTLPAGLMLNTRTGQINGMPTASITNTLLIFEVIDSTTPSAQTASVSLTLTVEPASITAPPSATLTITTTSLPSAQAGVPFAAALAATGGTPSYTWALIGGRIPPGLTLNALTGQISGTPISGQMTTVLTFQVNDSTTPAAQTANEMLILSVN